MVERFGLEVVTMRASSGLVVVVALAAVVACSSPPGAAVETGSALEAGSAPETGSPPDAGQHEGNDAGAAPTDAAGLADTTATTDGPSEATADVTHPEAGGTWSQVSYGITTLDVGSGPNIVIAYGGYTATDQDSQAWVTQMTTARLAQLGVGHLYAVRGPKDADYASREIGNSELAAVLATQATAASDVIVVAHSSGGFVADELFTFASAGVIAKMAYFNLDGGSWALTDALVGSMRGVYFCNAHDPVAGNSENTSSDESLHTTFPASHLFTVDATGSGCDVGAGWCLHDTLITNRPHNPATYDLALDYTDFTAGRKVVTSYIDRAVSDSVL